MPWDTKRDALREGASYLVQTSAIDSLSAFPGDDTLAAAMRLSASRHPLVRGYAYICVGMAGRSLGDEERAGQVQGEEPPVGFEVGEEYPQGAAGLIIFRGHAMPRLVFF